MFDIAQRIKDYFNLQATVASDETRYDYIVESAKPSRTILESIKDYFDLYSDYRAADKTAVAIMQLANTEKVAKGYFDPTTMTEAAGYSYTEGNFEVKLEKKGRVLLKCDKAFAEKVQQLPCVGAVTELRKPDAPQSAPDAPKP
ncbi:MAG: hypothetical protein ACAH83_07210 [Alphaproteobacteria bacterium]